MWRKTYISGGGVRLGGGGSFFYENKRFFDPWKRGRLKTRGVNACNNDDQ